MIGKKSIWSKTFFPVLLTYFIDNFGQAVVYPIFTPLFLKPNLHILGADFTFFHRTFLLGLLIASFPIAQCIGAPLFGFLSDRYGRKRLFLLTIAGGIIAYLCTGIGIHIRSLTLLWSGRALAGFFAGNLTLCLAAIADITTKDHERTRHFGHIGAIAGLGFVLAILTGASLSNPDLFPFFKPEIPFFVTSVLSLIAGLLLWAFFEDTNTLLPAPGFSWKNLEKYIVNTRVSLFYFGYFLFVISWVTALQFLSTYILSDYKVTITTITIAFSLIGLVWATANFLINPLLTKIIKPQTTFSLGLVLLSLALFLTLIPHQPLFLFLGHFCIAAFAAALCWTNGLSCISLQVGQTVQGRILGINQSIVAVGFILGPIVGGLIAGIDIHKLYQFSASSALLAALLMLKPSQS